jgi:hypothetical protein
MCLTVEWDLLDADSAEEEFDGSWKVLATGSANQASAGIGIKLGPLRESVHRETRRATQVRAGLSQTGKLSSSILAQ